MRKICLFPLLVSLLLITINSDFSIHEASASSIYNVTYISDVYEPKESYNNFDVTGSVIIHGGLSNNNLILKYDLYSPFKYGDEESYKSGYVGQALNYTFETKVNYSFNINDNKNYARKGIKVRFGLYNKVTNRYLDYIDRYLYNKEELYIDIDDINGDYEVDRCFSLNSSNKGEIYNFSNYSHLLELDNYYRLDLSSLSFSYKYNKDYKVDSAYLSFIDFNNVFPYISREGEYKRIPLYPVIKGNEISFRFKDLYVLAKTLDMSLTYQDGFIETNYFYLPKNQLRLLQGHLFALNIINSGVNSLCFDYEFEIYVNSLLLGPCNEATYCVVGEVKS